MHFPLTKRPSQLLIAVAIGWSSYASAAYRVFKLEVRSFDERNRPLKKQVVLSNLDPNQYENYHGGYGKTEVKLLDTWFCPGDTSRHAYCPKPKESSSLRAPAGLIAPKRTAP